MTNVNTNSATTQDFNFLDQIINLETARKIKRVDGAKQFNIDTACVINDVFILVSEYDITSEMYEKLKNA
jgi:hypothetical protein